MGDFLSSAAFRPGSSSLRRPPAQVERRQTEDGSSTTEQSRGEFGNHGAQEVQHQSTTDGAATTLGVRTVGLSQQEQMRQARINAFSNPQQSVQELGAPGINHTVAQVFPPKQKKQGLALSTAKCNT